MRFLLLPLVLAALAAPAARAQLAAGGAHTCLVLGNGDVKCWGSAREGQLGLGSPLAVGDEPGEMGRALPRVPLGGEAVAVVAGAFHTCALLGTGAPLCWGAGRDGETGAGTSQARGDAPGEVAALAALDLGEPVAALAAGANHTCALLASGAVKCWGANAYGQLGLGSREATGDAPGEVGPSLPAVPLPAPAVALSAGADHTCAVLLGGAVACWGRGDRGQLGSGNRAARGDTPDEVGAPFPTVPLGRAASAVAAGGEHTCALFADGAVKCWGGAFYGQTGLGARDARGDMPGEIEALPDVDIGGRVVELAAGARHTCARLEGGAVKCWGAGVFGQTGAEATEAIGDAPGEMGPNLAPVVLHERAVALAAGATHTCALFEDASLRCWGSGADGRLGIGDTRTRGDGPGEMGYALPPTDAGGPALAVELTTFTASADGPHALLAWTTASETSNAGFAVETRRAGDDAWREIAFVPGHGTTPNAHAYAHRAPAVGAGRHAFRLRQVDTDGAADYSATVEVEATLAEDAALTRPAPNPFAGSTRLTLTVARPQHVAAHAYDLLGRRVSVLFDGALEANAPETLTFDGANLPAGVYLIRVQGETFTRTERAVLAR